MRESVRLLRSNRLTEMLDNVTADIGVSLYLVGISRKLTFGSYRLRLM